MQITRDHFDIHRRCHIGIFFAAFWNTDMSVSTLEISLLCDDQYFNLRFFYIIFFIVLYICEVIVYVMLCYYIVVGWIAPYIDLWRLCADPAWI